MLGTLLLSVLPVTNTLCMSLIHTAFGRELVTKQAMDTAITSFDSDGKLELASRIVCVPALARSENDHQMYVDLVALAARGLRVFLVTNDNDLLRYWRPQDPARPGVVVYTDGANKAVALVHSPGSAEHLHNIHVSRDYFKTQHALAEVKVAKLTLEVAEKASLMEAAKKAVAAAQPCFDAAEKCVQNFPVVSACVCRRRGSVIF